ncbi:MAG TPA: polysaccharide deacetylase family protein [Pirellulales bacterium]
MVRRLCPAWVVCLALAASLSAAEATNPAPSPPIEWSWEWRPTQPETAPQVEVCPLKFDKKWAYAVEIDDGPSSTYTVALPLLAEFSFTDAPPGASGGRKQPFVGGAAVIVLRVDGGNDTFLSWDQLRDLEKRGWRTVNHSYWHKGNHWDPKAALVEADVRRELFWSQAILAEGLEPNGAPTHFVYPNGYVIYEPFLAAYGLRSSSRVGGTSKRRFSGEGVKWTDLDRNYLDEGVWSKANDPLVGLRADPQPGDFVIDFTHGVEGDPNSPNHRRWRERLRYLFTKFGQAGDDSLWCAPPSEIVEYAQAAKAAQVSVKSGRVSVSLPADFAGVSLTLRLSGVDAASITAPVGGRIHSQNDRVWLTTPALGTPDANAPTPRVERIYEGPVKDLKFEKPIRLAGVRLRQNGGLSGEKKVKIAARSLDGAESVLVDEATPDNWGAWLLYPTIPDRPAPLVSEVKISPDKALQRCEIWAIKE